MRAGDVRLGDVWFGDVRLSDVRLGDVRLGAERFGDVRAGEKRTIVWPGGVARHYANGRLHREGGPAVTIKGTFEAWYQRGDPHRIIDPAAFERTVAQTSGRLAKVRATVKRTVAQAKRVVAQVKRTVARILTRPAMAGEKEWTEADDMNVMCVTMCVYDTATKNWWDGGYFSIIGCFAVVYSNCGCGHMPIIPKTLIHKIWRYDKVLNIHDRYAMTDMVAKYIRYIRAHTQGHRARAYAQDHPADSLGCSITELCLTCLESPQPRVFAGCIQCGRTCVLLLDFTDYRHISARCASDFAAVALCAMCA